MSCITVSRLQCCCSSCNACGTAPALRRTAPRGPYHSSACHSRRHSSRRQRGTNRLATATIVRAILRMFFYLALGPHPERLGRRFVATFRSVSATPSRAGRRAAARERRDRVPSAPRPPPRAFLPRRRDLVVAPRRTLVLLGNLVILPARFDQTLVFEFREGGIHRAARQAGGGDDVEAVAGAGGQRLQDGDQSGAERQSGHM